MLNSSRGRRDPGTLRLRVCVTIQVTQKSYDDCRICRQGSRELILKAWVAKSGVLSRREGEFVERVCLMEDSGWNS